MIGALLLILGGTLMGASALWHLEQRTQYVHRVLAPQRIAWRVSRQMWGLFGATILGSLVWAILRLLDIKGLVGFLAVGIVVLAVGFVVPRRPLVAEQKRTKAIRLSLPAAVNEWRISIQAGDTLPAIMRRYVLMPRKARKDIQDVINRALAMIDQGERRNSIDERTNDVVSRLLRLGEALVESAQASGCQELITVMKILNNADQGGGLHTSVDGLAQEEKVLRQVVTHERDQLFSKRGLQLIAGAAPSVVGTLILILFIAAAGALTSL